MREIHTETEKERKGEKTRKRQKEVAHRGFKKTNEGCLGKSHRMRREAL